MSQFNYLQKKYTEFEYPNNNLNNNTSEPIIVKKKNLKKYFAIIVMNLGMLLNNVQEKLQVMVL